jgi:hypothetical protein
MKVTPPKTSYEMKEIMKGMKHDKDLDTDDLQAERFR